MKIADNSQKEKKIQREKEKLLVTSNFSFSHCVFERLALQTRKNQGLFGKGLISNDLTTRFMDCNLVTQCLRNGSIFLSFVLVELSRGSMRNLVFSIYTRKLKLILNRYHSRRSINKVFYQHFHCMQNRPTENNGKCTRPKITLSVSYNPYH